MGATTSLNRRGAFVVVALSALMILSACGGGDDGDSTGADEPTATATRAEDEQADEATPADDENDATPEVEDEDRGNDGGDLDVCALLTEEEIEEITGVDVSAGTDQSIESFLSCHWSTETFDYVQLDVFHGSRTEVEAYYELTTGGEPVDGVGDRAQKIGGILNMLEVLYGEYDVTIEVNVTDTDEAQSLEQSIELAELVLERLP